MTSHKSVFSDCIPEIGTPEIDIQVIQEIVRFKKPVNKTNRGQETGSFVQITL